jgi:molybdopterin/thiamine biosynthesis adenylyltransferase
MRRPRVKSSVCPAQFPGHRVQLGWIYDAASEITDDDEDTVWRLLELMDGTRSPARVAAAIVAERPSLDEASVHEAIEGLMESGYIEDAAAGLPDDLGPDELERYSRNNEFFTCIDTTPRQQRYELQHRLKQSRVAVIGLGGVGSTVAMSLTAAGVGTIRCVDFDVVEPSNLTRQLLYAEDNVGASKVTSAVARLRAMNKHAAIEGVELELSGEADARRCLDGMDFAVLCTDHPREKVDFLVNDVAQELGTPWAVCSYNGPLVCTGVIIPNKTPCYRCFTHTHPSPWAPGNDTGVRLMPRSSSLMGVIAPTAGLAGHLVALEVIYYLTGLRVQTAGRIWYRNMFVYDQTYSVELSYWTECPACGNHGG